uniref:Uncharacterized protein n=1 Tax=Arundo donax TaxID=35708 RepID=A0A0A9C6Q3_ARUDO
MTNEAMTSGWREQDFAFLKPFPLDFS